MSEKIEQRARVSYVAGRKLSDGNYGSRDFHITCSIDVEEGETKKQALDRVVKFVHKELRAIIKKVEKD